jgi:5'-methylthioadenosine phosphorylase
LANLSITRREVVRTPFGEPSSALVFGQVGETELAFLARHGQGHVIPPHRVNYRANIWALHAAGVKRVVAVASVGGIRADHGPGVLVIPDQLIDYTSGRAATYFDGHDQKVVHIDFTHPYTPELRRRLVAAGGASGVELLDGGVYAAVSGPRLETAAEIDRLERDGATMVGMTGMPEAVLARELGLEYAAVAVVANYAAGRASSRDEVSLEQISVVLDPAMKRVHALIEALLKND